MSIKKSTGFTLVLFQIVLIIAFALLATYGDDADTKNINPMPMSTDIYYPMFQDIQVMILIGFGMLMMYMKRYSYSGAGLNFLISAVTFQYGLLLQRIFGPLKIGMPNLIDADVTAASVLISMGAVLGKTTPLQLLVMTILEVPVYMGNKYLSTFLKVADIGGSVTVHTFGAYFGLGVSRILGRPKNTSLEEPCYNSDLLSVVGTLFLWIFWPSFNGALSWADGQQRAVINTYLSLIASCVVSFALSSLCDKTNKFTMAHVQNGTLAGGVAVGTVADLLLVPYAALVLGAIAGAITTLGFVYVQPWLLRHLDLHDTCGVNNLHGLPSILAGIAGIIVAATASTDKYGPKLFLLFPARSPLPSSPELKEARRKLTMIMPGELRSASSQALYQLLGLIFTFLISIIGGVITGVILKLVTSWFGGVPDEYTHDDSFIWSLPKENESAKRKHSTEVTNIPSLQNSIGVM